MNPDTTWLSSTEAARSPDVSLHTLYQFIERGELPGYRFGRLVRIKRRDLERFIESCRIELGTLGHLYL